MAENLPDEAATAPSPSTQSPPRETRSKRHRWVWVLLVLVLLGVALLFWLRRPKQTHAAAPPVAISTTNVWQGEIPVSVTALGSVLPIYTAGISPRVDGQLLNVHYTEGQLVKTNDLLVTIDPGPFEAALIQAEGALARDQALLESAQIDLKRYQAAYTRKAVPEQQVADQQALVHQYEGTVKLDQGALENARVQLAYCFVRAPFTGRIGLRLVDPGNVVHAANTNAMLTIVELQPITVLFSVSEDFLQQIQQQVRAEHPMTVEAYDRTQSNKLATGAFLTMDNQVDPTTGTIRIKGIFTNEDFTLFPSQFVNARLVIQILTNQTLIPTFAVQRNPEGAFVYVVTNRITNEVVKLHDNIVTNQVTNEVVTMRNIKVDVTDQNISSVQGVQPGETIAVDNFNKLGEGVQIAVRPATGTNQVNRGSATSQGPPANTGRTNIPATR